MMSGCSLPLTGLIFVLLQCGGLSGGDRRYSLSEDPNHELLSIRWSCTPFPTRRFALYGNGRLVGKMQGCRDTDPVAEKPVEVWLRAEELKAIVEVVVDAGLVEYEPGDMQETLGPPTFPTHSPGLWLRIALASYKSPQRKELRPFVHSTGIGSPSSLIRRYAEAKAAGRIAESEPHTFVEAETLLHLYKRLERLVYPVVISQ